jgi:glycosyl transferase family 87
VIAQSETSFRRAELRRAGVAAALGIALLSVSWGLLHVGHYDELKIVDTPVYQRYGEAVLAGELPYRDFVLEYPPGALPMFILPAFPSEEHYRSWFEALMWICAAAAIACLAYVLTAVGADLRRLYAAVVFAGLAPLALGSLVLSRFDLWPAALTAAALAALVAGRERLGFGALGLAVAAKLFPFVLLPLAVIYTAQRRGARDATIGLAVFVAVLAAVFLPFAILAPDGLWVSFDRQLGRPLQIESLGSSILLALQQFGVYSATVVSSFGSQNLDGALPDALATLQTVVTALAVVAVWLVFAAGRGNRECLLTGSAAAVTAVVAFGKVLSPQFLVWLIPLVPLVAARTGLVASGFLFCALVTTQLWFPSRYWDVVALRSPGWLVLVRDLMLVGLFVVLLAGINRRLGPLRNE